MRFVVTANFTAEPLRASLLFWGERLGGETSVEFLPYNQVIPGLLDPAGLLRKNRSGVNGILFRLEDCLRDRRDLAPAGRAEALRTAGRELIAALRGFAAEGASGWVLICPPSPALPERPLVLELTEEIRRVVADCPGLRWVDPAPLAEAYGVTRIEDPVRDELGHIPFTREYFDVLGTALARRAAAARMRRFKVIVVDCDQTLWRGVCGEVGAAGVAFDPWHLELQRLLVAQQAAGRLIVLCSKNAPEDVWAVFDGRPEMPLRREHVVDAEINWEAKSRNLRTLAKRLNLGLDSFVFLDDNALECAEVRAHLPMVLTVAWPSEPAGARRVLDHLWALDVEAEAATTEDARRTELYRAEQARARARAGAADFAAFLRGLRLKVGIALVRADETGRVAQLLQRTNQFNFTGLRREATELGASPDDPARVCLTVRVSDRCGDYGLVGAVLARVDGAELAVESLVLSCRALWRGVEHRMLRQVGALARRKGCRWVRLRFVRTARNEPAWRFFQSVVGARARLDANGVCELRVTVDRLRALEFKPATGGQNPEAESGKTDVATASTNVNAPGAPGTAGAAGAVADAETFNAVLLRIVEDAATGPELARAIHGDAGAAAELPGAEGGGAVARVRRVFAATLKVAPETLDLDAPLESHVADSFANVELTAALRREFGPSVPATVLFEQRCLRALAAALADDATAAASLPSMSSPSPVGVSPFPAPQSAAGEPIAIIGLAGVYPGAANADELWENLRAGRVAIGEVPPGRRELAPCHDPAAGPGKTTCRHGGFLADVDRFDAGFFRIAPKEAEHMDPQQRLFLQVVWQLWEDAGYTRATLDRETGVFVGVIASDYALLSGAAALAGEAAYRDSDYYQIANRVSYFFDLKGPSLALDTACSASGTALHLACQALRSGDCRQAIVGGVNLFLHPSRFVQYARMGFLSRDEKVRPFGAGATGTLFGEGVGAVLLKPLSAAERDGDVIHGLIRATAVNSGGRTNGFTVPNPQAQGELVARALRSAGVDPRTVTYVEAHGTGTPLGDPIEVRGLGLGFAAAGPGADELPRQFCALGSVKANIGHLESAAALPGIAKILLQMRHGEIAPSLHADQTNPEIAFAETPFYVATRVRPWPRPTDASGRELPRRAGLSSFGAGGANAHVVLEEYLPATAPRDTMGERPERPEKAELIVLSAAGEERLRVVAGRLAKRLARADAPGLAAVAHTLQVGREALAERLALVAGSVKEAAEKLAAFVAEERVVGLWRGRAGVGSGAGGGSDLADPSGLSELSASSEPGEWALRWTRGGVVDWATWRGGPTPRRVSLPTYPFAGRRHWLETSASAQATQPAPARPAPVPTPTPALGAGCAPDTTVLRILERVWRPAPASARASTRTAADDARARPSPAGSVVVLTSGGSPAVWAGAEGLGLRPVRVEADFADEAAARDAARRVVAERGPELVGCVDLSDWAEGAENTDCAARVAGTPGLTKIAFVQELLVAARAEPWFFFHVSDGRGAAGAVTGALAAMLGAEYRRVVSRRIAVDFGPAETGRLAGVLAEEFGETSGDGASDVSHLGGVRRAAALVEVGRAEAGRGARPRFSAENVYVVTGGTRGLGLAVARRLVEGGARKLVLMGRRPLPPPTEWAERARTGVVAAQNASENAAQDAARFSELLALRAMGAELETFAGELGDEARLRAFFDDVRRRLGPIAGVVHAAGLGDAEHPAFVQKPLANIRAVLAPKVAGLRALDRALGDGPLEFFVLFSSVATQAPLLAAGLSDYAAANAFMEAYARERAAAGRTEFRALSWGNWAETGMGEVKSAAYRAAGLRSLRTREGLALLDAALAMPAAPHRVLLGTAEVFSPEALSLAKAPRSAPVVTQPASVAPPPPATATAAPTTSTSATPSAGANDGGTREALRELFSRELKIPVAELDPATPFGDFGVDSILLAALVKRIELWAETRLDATVLLEHPTLDALAAYFDRMPGMAARISDAGVPPELPVSALPVSERAVFERAAAARQAEEHRVAVIGLACQFPDAPDIARFWENLCAGRCSIREVPRSRWDVGRFYSPRPAPGKSISKWGGFLDDVESFDPGAFNIAEDLAPHVDPLVRQFLETSLQAVRHAGYERAEWSGKRVGVFVGSRVANYAERIEKLHRSSIVGTGQNFIAAHLSDLFNLRGPSLVVDSACSSSLVALHLAARSLLSGETDFAVAGGVDILLDELPYLNLSEGRALSPDGLCHTFDERANGFVPGEGCGVVILKSLARASADGDRIYAVLDGSAVNNDGHTMGITTPNPAAQREVIESALAAAGVSAASVGYVEAHGTGTMIGDPIELKALTQVFRGATEARGVCGVGSVKTNIGHLLSAAGIASFIKVVLSLHHGRLPATLHCHTPNPRFEFARSPFYPLTEACDWTRPADGGARRAGISSFGFGGTNCHVIVSEAPAPAAADGVARRAPLAPPVFRRRRFWLEPRKTDSVVAKAPAIRPSRRPLLELTLL